MADNDTLETRHLQMDQTQESSLTPQRSLCSLKENEAAHMAFVLEQVSGDRKEAARILNVSVRQVQRKLVQLKNHPRWGRVIRQY
jgi:DNA-binding NtrC family response regulator